MMGRHLGVGDTVTAFGTQYTLLLAPHETEGRMTVYTSVCPSKAGPPWHVHHNEDETFYIVSGTVEFWMNGNSRTLSAGECMFIPKGAEHTFYVDGSEPAHLITILAPGGFEEFFFAVAEQNLALPQDLQAMMALAKQFHLSFTGRPLHIDN